MLQAVDAATEPGPRAQPAAHLTADDIAWLARRYAAIVALAACAAVLAGLGYVLLQQPVFTATAQLLIDPKPTFLLREQLAEGNAVLDTPQIESQIVVIKSERVLGKVADKHEEALARLRSAAGDGLLSRILGQSTTPPSRDQLRKAYIGQLQGSTDVKRVGLSHVLDISFRATDRELAAQLANAIAEAFVRDQFDVRTEASRKGGEWLEERIDDLRQQMNAAALAVQEFKARRDYRIPGRQGDGGGAGTGDGAAKSPPGAKAPPAPEITSLEELETRAYSYRKIYESYLQAYTEALQRQSYPIAGGRIIAAASAPSRKSHPRTLLTLIIAGGLGAMAGLGIAIVVHMLSAGVRSGRQLVRVAGIDCLADVRFGGRAGIIRTLLWWLPYRRRRGLDSASGHGGRSRLSGGLALANQLRDHMSIGFASPSRGAGRTTLAIEVATRLHASGRRVLLVDADIADPMLTRLHSAEGEPGLLDVLARRTEIADAARASASDGPSLLALGTPHHGPTLDAAVLRGSAQHMLEAAREHFDHVVFDLPTCGRDPDGTTLAARLDACVLVVAASATPEERLAEMISGLGAAKVRLAGTVLNHPRPG